MPLPTWMNVNRRVMRAPRNPIDKSTVVSVYPKQIYSLKPTIEPGEFWVPAGNKDKPGVLTVGPSSWWREVEDTNVIEIPTSSIAVADSIVKDFCNGLIAVVMGEISPGLFVLPGEHTAESLLKESKTLLEAANQRQRKWYEALVFISDNLWARTNGNPLCINDDARVAATELGFKDKPWLKDFQKFQLTNCPACGNLRDERFPVCPNCKSIIDKKKYAEMGMGIAV